MSADKDNDSVPEVEADSKGKPQDTTGREHLPKLLLAALVVGILALGVLSWERTVLFAATVLWGMALYVAGLLGGFIFAIPRVAKGEAGAAVKAKSADKRPPGEKSDIQQVPAGDVVEGTRSLPFSSVNSNLVEVSDWLTKIIVGVGLVELKSLGASGLTLAAFMAASMAPEQNAAPGQWLVSIAGAIALFFGLLGFITGYLMTRVFLAVVMSIADRDADQASRVRLPSGEIVNVDSLLAVFRRQITDLQQNLMKLLPFDPRGGSRSPAAPSAPGGGDSRGAESQPGGSSSTSRLITPARYAKVLWIDSRPTDNALIVDRLKAAGISVDQVATTNEVLDRIQRGNYSLLITDMHRREQDAPGHPAGIDLLEKLQARFPDNASRPFSIAVYASPNSVRKYGGKAHDLGSDKETSSELELMSLLESLFPQLQ